MGQSTFSEYLSNAHFRLGNCVLPPSGSIQFDPGPFGSVFVPTQEHWFLDNDPLPKLFPSGFKTQGCKASNRGTKVGLAFTLNVSSRAALVFFGSRARGTHSEKSDVDLLLIAPDCDYEGHDYGRLSLYTISPRQAQARAQNGDLFIGSLLRTGKTLSDPRNHMDRLAKAFRAAEKPEIRAQAAAVGTLLLSNQLPQRLPLLVAARSLWSLRTILMAEGVDVFENNAGLGTSDRKALDLLRAARDRTLPDVSIAFDAFFAALQARDLVECEWFNAGLNAWAARFANDGNVVGKKTISAIESHLKRSGQE